MNAQSNKGLRMARKPYVKYALVTIFSLLIIIQSFSISAIKINTADVENIDDINISRKALVSDSDNGCLLRPDEFSDTESGHSPEQELIKMILPQDSTYVTYLDKDNLIDSETKPGDQAEIETSTHPLANIPVSHSNPLEKPGYSIIVNSTIYPLIKTSLEQYSRDVNATGYDTKIITGTWPTVQEVRAVLKDEWQNNGTTAGLLIGNFSIPWYIHNDETFPIDLYYMDLDGIWGDANSDGVFDSHTGNVAADIIFGRLPAHILSGNEAQLLNNFFRKAHLYRTGQLKLPNKNLVYVDDDWRGSANGWKNDASINYDNVTLVKNGITTCEIDYKNRLLQDYEFIEVHCHANHLPTRHNFKVNGVFESGDVNSSDIRSIDPHTFFTILFTCGAANYSARDFLAGWYTFADTYGLVSISSAKVGGMLNYDDFYRPLSENKTIGEAFKDWFVKTAENSRSWFYGMTLIGDPLLTPNMYDLEFVNITFSNELPYDDEMLYIHTNIQNIFDNCSDIEVSLYDGNPSAAGELIETKDLVFGWNETAEINFSWLASAGDHEFWVVVDHPDNLLEFNESNNLGYNSITVYSLPEVELIPNRTVVYTYENINFTGVTSGGYGELNEYYFEFGDGNDSGIITQNHTIFNYTENGEYSAKFKVIDINNRSIWSTKVLIEVLNQAPLAILETDLPEGLAQVQTGTVIHFNGSRSYDPDGNITAYF